MTPENLDVIRSIEKRLSYNLINVESSKLLICY